MIYDLFPASATVLDLDPWLDGPGCELQLNIGFSSVLGLPTGSSFEAGLPIPTGFAGLHLYAQGLQFGSAGGGATQLLDINIQDS